MEKKEYNILSFILIILFFQSIAYADIFNVTNTNDSGEGSLRQAIIDANNHVGSDTIIFNIPKNDPNFNGIIWTILPLSGLPALDDTTGGTFINGTTQASNVENTNQVGPEIEISGTKMNWADGLGILSSNNRISGFIIIGFKYFGYGGRGIYIKGKAVVNNIISGNYIGINYDGSLPVGNGSHGISIYEASSNVIGGNSVNERNIISGNGHNGIMISGISGNTSKNNLVAGNLIGTDLTGTKAIPNHDNGIQFEEADSNFVGGTTIEYRNIISGNGENGILINRGSSHNTISNNFIGTDINGTFAIPNMLRGIALSYLASFNIVGGDSSNMGNLISGNNLDGVLCGESNTNNKICGNLIGTDAVGTSAIPNKNSGIRIQNSQFNVIGGGTPKERNIISGNNMSGITIYYHSHKNSITGNYIGTDISGTVGLKNGGDGINIYDSNSNIIGGRLGETGNLISGNDESGIFIDYGAGEADSNKITGNLIGTDKTGILAIPNGSKSGQEYGVWVMGGSYNIIGGIEPCLRNIISGNKCPGIGIQLANAFENKIIGNFIGTDFSGTQLLGNSGIGIDIIAGKNNYIQKNVISGNLDGIMTDGRLNSILGNYIGTDINGRIAIPNRRCGIYIKETLGTINGGRLNIIGGEDVNSRNIISGNLSHGIYIANADSNEIIGNYIGVDITGDGALGNHGNGIFFTLDDPVPPGTYSESNIIGPNNVIANNYVHGIEFAFSGIGNTITKNSITSNNGKGIFYNFSVIQPPIIYNVDSISVDSIQVTGKAVPNSNIEIFSDKNGEGKFYEGSVVLNGEDSIFVWRGVARDTMITATATDTNGNTSEFCTLPIPNPNPTIVNIPELNSLRIPLNYLIEQNYPNPFNSNTIIEYQVPKSAVVSIKIYNIAGQLVKTLINKKQIAGKYSITWNGTDELNQYVSSGVYFCRFTTNEFNQTKKILFLQ